MMTVEFKRDISPIVMPNVFNRPSFLSLFSSMPEMTLKKGEVIFNGRTPHQYVYLMTKGMVKIYSFHDGKEMMEDYFLKGELFNCGAFLNNFKGDVIAEAMTQLTAVRKMPLEVFRQAMHANTSLYREVLNSFSTSLDRSHERLRRMTLLDSRKRIIDFVFNHTKKAGRRVGYEFVVKPAITHKEIGIIAGTSRQTATTVLNELRSKGIIHFNRSYLIVRDLEALGKMMSGD